MCGPFEQVTRQLGDVLAALAQRRHLDDQPLESLVQVVTERALCHHVPYVPVGGGHELDVGALVTVGPHAPELARLDHAQQRRLQVARQVTDLVEEQHPLVRLLEQAATALVRTGERAGLVTEQLAGQGARRDVRQAAHHQRSVSPSSHAMDVSGHHLLARARLAKDQDRDVAVASRSLGVVPRLLHRR